MATITVNTTLDELDGSIFDGDVSLRDALAVAVHGDVIEFSSSLFSADRNPSANTTITLSLGELVIVQDIEINGDVNGDGIADVSLSGGGTERLFSVQSSADVVFRSLTFQNGYSASGGAIIISSGTNVSVANSLFLYNFANFGGAITHFGNLSVSNTAFFGNYAGADGGAIFVGDGLDVANSTFFGNSAMANGGAIRVQLGETVNLNNVTITGNYAGTSGGISSETVATGFVGNSILLGNRDSSGVSDFDGILISNGNNIFGTSTTGTITGDQLVGVAGFANVFESVGATTAGGATFDSGQLTIQNGITPIIGIADGGLAIDAGDNADIPSEADLGFDVDGDGSIETGPLERDASGFDRIVDGTTDIGASENYKNTWTVSTTSDVDDGDLTTGNLSLREAIRVAEDGDLVIFDGSVFSADGDERSNATIALTQGQIFIGNSRTITIDGDTNGDGIADVTLDGAGNNNQNMLYVAPGAGAKIHALTFQNASSIGASGGAVATNGTTTILNSTFLDNYSSGFAGALRTYASSDVVIANTTFEGNTSDAGGAIRNTGNLTIFNSTFHGNFAQDTSGSDGGGAIENTSGGNLYITNSTFTGNIAALEGGAILLEGTGTFLMNNNILVGNVEGRGTLTSYIDDVSSTSTGTNISNGGNVFGASVINTPGDAITTATATFDAVTSVFNGGFVATAGVIGDNGGTTDTVLILQGGAAVDQGISGDIPTESALGIDVNRDDILSGSAVDIDQRGSIRDFGSSVDAGAVELDTSLIIVTTTEDTRDGDLSAGDISWREALGLRERRWPNNL